MNGLPAFSSASRRVAQRRVMGVLSVVSFSSSASVGARAKVERHHLHRGPQLGGKRPRRRQQHFFDRGGEHVAVALGQFELATRQRVLVAAAAR